MVGRAVTDDGGLGRFAATVDRLVGPFLAEQGFARGDQTPSEVTYRRQRVVVSLACLIEDVFRPCLLVEVGTVGDDGSTQSVGLWRTMPEGDRGAAGDLWTFHDAESLEQVLHRLVAEVLPTYGPRLWDSPEALSRALAASADEAEARYVEDCRRGDLLRARRAYEEGRLQEAVDGFVLLGSSALSAADRRRLHQARKRLDGGPDS